MDAGIEIPGQLKTLLRDYNFNIKTLSSYLSLDERKIAQLSEGDVDCLPDDNLYRFRLFNKISFLYNSAAEEKDLKLSAFLQVLISSHGISKDTIAKMAGVAKKEVEAALAYPMKPVSDEAKYKIAVTVMALRYFLKDCELN